MDRQTILNQLENYIQLPTRKSIAQMSEEGSRVLRIFVTKYLSYLEATGEEIGKQSLANFTLSYQSTNSRALCVRRIGKFLLWYKHITLDEYKDLMSIFRFQKPKWSQKALDVALLPTLLHNIKKVSKTEFSRHRNLFLFLLLAGTAARIKQVLELKLEDIEERDNCFLFKIKSMKKIEGKHSEFEPKIVRKDFSIGLFDFEYHFKKYLKFRKQIDGSDFLFVTSTGKRLTPEEVRIFCDKISKELSFKVTPHIIRHTIATYIAQTQGLLQASFLLGHQNIQTTQLYVEKDKFETFVPNIKV